MSFLLGSIRSSTMIGGFSRFQHAHQFVQATPPAMRASWLIFNSKGDLFSVYPHLHSRPPKYDGATELQLYAQAKRTEDKLAAIIRDIPIPEEKYVQFAAEFQETLKLGDVDQLDDIMIRMAMTAALVETATPDEFEKAMEAFDAEFVTETKEP